MEITRGHEVGGDGWNMGGGRWKMGHGESQRMKWRSQDTVYNLLIYNAYKA
jgi:hypothetical protein